MKIAIYQIDSARDNERVAFLGFDELQRFQKESGVKSSIYNKVYDENVNCKTLEDVYRMFNLNIPDDYNGRSLSVSDVVEIKENEKAGFYYCDSYGFKEIPFMPQMCQVAEKVNEKKIRIILVRPGERPEITEVKDSLAAMQRLVSGDIEQYMPFKDDVAIVCNEEGKINGLQLNRAVYDETGEIIDIIAGDFFLCYAPIESEKFLSIPDELVDKYMKLFEYPERFYREDDRIVARKIM